MYFRSSFRRRIRARRLGEMSVYKDIPDFFPNDVGGVGSLLGALRGFFLSPVFGAVGCATGAPRSAFLVLLALTAGSLVWLRLVVVHRRHILAANTPELALP